MTVLTSSQISKLNRMNRAAQDSVLGTRISLLDSQAIVRGSYTAVTADDTANKMVIASGLAAIAGWMVQIYRAGVDVTADAVVTVASTTNLQIADGGATYSVTAGDVLKYIIW